MFSFSCARCFLSGSPPMILHGKGLEDQGNLELRQPMGREPVPDSPRGPTEVSPGRKVALSIWATHFWNPFLKIGRVLDWKLED